MIDYRLNPFSRADNIDHVHKVKTVSILEFPDTVELVVDTGAEFYSTIELYEHVERTKRGEGDRARSREVAARRARTMVRRRCQVIQADCMLTLTYRELVTDENRVQSDLKRLVARFRQFGRFEYVAALEKQKRGALHVHLACQQFPVYMRNDQGVRVKSYNLIRSMWRRIVGQDNGNVDLTRPRGRNSAAKIARYISKYVGKGLEDALFNKKSYWSSKGIVMPRPVKLWFYRGEDTCDIIALAIQDYLKSGLTEVCQYHDRIRGFYWFSLSRAL